MNKHNEIFGDNAASADIIGDNAVVVDTSFLDTNTFSTTKNIPLVQM